MLHLLWRLSGDLVPDYLPCDSCIFNEEKVMGMEVEDLERFLKRSQVS